MLAHRGGGLDRRHVAGAFNIVLISLSARNLPSAWGRYVPTFWDWAIFVGTIGLFLTGFLLALRLVPMVSMFEMRELLSARKGRHDRGLFDAEAGLARALRAFRGGTDRPAARPTRRRRCKGEPATSPIPLIILVAGLIRRRGELSRLQT